jgi:arginyl-tRNA synthetase
MSIPCQIIKESLERAAKKLVSAEKLPTIELETPPSLSFGDYASNLPFYLAKILKTSAMQVAAEIVGEIQPVLANYIEKIEVVEPGYINFTLSKKWLQNNLKDVLVAVKEKKSREVKRQKVIIEYSSPNIAKRMHVGHLRSTFIGHCLDNLFRYLGYEVISDNHLGDWGTQFGQLLIAYKLWSADRKPENLTVSELENLYVRFHQELKSKPELAKQARAETVKLQQGDRETNSLWQIFYQTSLKEFNYIYNLLGINFDYQNGESFYAPMLPEIVKEALEKGIARKSEGAIIIALDDVGLPPFLIQKADGGYLYSTTDLATIKWREENLQPDLVLYVVADQQELYFRQLFEAAKKLGFIKKSKLVHIPFGLILSEEGKKISTREGEAIDALFFINRAIELAEEIVREKLPDISSVEQKEIAKKIGIAALIYNDLSRDRTTAVAFNWNKMMNLKGASAPYLLYTYVRLQGILRKAGEGVIASDFDPSFLNESEELTLLRLIVKFEEILETVTLTYKPNLLTNYLEELASAFHLAYDKVPILTASSSKLRLARLALFQAVGLIIKTGLNILGIEIVDRM